MYEKLIIGVDDETRHLIRDVFGASRTNNDILKIVKEILKNMATQNDIDAITQQLESIKTEVAKIGTDLADFINDNPSITVDALRAKATEVAEALQALDDTLPEATP